MLSRSFFELAKTFLGFKFHQTKGGRNNTIVMYQFPLPDSPIVHEFRSMLWNALKANFSTNTDWAFDTLKSYSKVHPDVIKEIMIEDVPKVVSIISEHLEPENFEHCKYVQAQIRWCKRHDIIHDDFPSLVKLFSNPLYELYLILDWDRFRDKDSFEFDDYKEYERLKEEQIRNSIKLSSQEEIAEFYTNFTYLKKESTNDWAYLNVLNIVIDETMCSNVELGYSFLKLIIDKNNEIGLIPRTLFQNILKDEKQAERIWKLLISTEFESQHQMENDFLLFSG